MPAGAARTPRGIPASAHLASRISTARSREGRPSPRRSPPGAAAQILDPPVRQRAVGWKRAHVVVDVPVRAAIRNALFDQPLHHRDDRPDVMRRMWFHVRVEHPESAAVLVHVSGEALRQRTEVFPVLVRAGDDLVVDVGDVAHVGHPVAQTAQVADDRVEHHEHPRVGRGGSSRRRSCRRRTCGRARARSGGIPPSIASACCRSAA